MARVLLKKASNVLDLTDGPLPGTAGHAQGLLGGEPKQKVEDVPLREIVTTQRYLDLDKVQDLSENPPKDEDPKPILLELGDRKYVLDGHHRLAAAAQAGDRVLPSRVIYLGTPGTDSKGRKLVVKADAQTEDQRLVWGEVYAPNRPDVHGEYMDAEAIRTMAYNFMSRALTGSVDVQHDNQTVPGCTIVESFIARPGDPDFIAGSWVVCCHIDDDALWAQVKAGDLNGFSVEALVVKEDHEVTVDIPPVVRGTTSETNGHTHAFAVTFAPDGTFQGGKTDVTDGHTHQIVAGTITEESQGHTHRFSSVDDVVITSESPPQ